MVRRLVSSTLFLTLVILFVNFDVIAGSHSHDRRRSHRSINQHEAPLLKIRRRNTCSNHGASTNGTSSTHATSAVVKTSVTKPSSTASESSKSSTKFLTVKTSSTPSSSIESSSIESSSTEHSSIASSTESSSTKLLPVKPSPTTTFSSTASSSTASSSTKISSTESAATKPSPTKASSPPVKQGSGGGKPSNWPSATQKGAAPASTVTSAADPFLQELSKAYDNTNNPLFNTVYQGDMTYYGQGLGACGDTYDDESFTAAVSMILFDSWPGASAEQNRNPICGPFSPGRKTINAAGSFVAAIAGGAYVNIGGDGLLNCALGVQCHIPLTATVKHGGKSIQVKIVDRCVGCKKGDIDLTPAAFAALADMGLGRTDVEWYFNKY